jgi:hypothetical protein
MSVLDEMENIENFERMVFVEFLEFIGRLADYIYDDMELEVKLKMFLDKVFPIFRITRREVHVEEQDDALSDDEN